MVSSLVKYSLLISFIILQEIVSLSLSQLTEHHDHPLDHDSASLAPSIQDTMILEPDESENIAVSTSPSSVEGDSFLVRPKLLFARSRYSSQRHPQEDFEDDDYDQNHQRNYREEDDTQLASSPREIVHYPLPHDEEAASEKTTRQSSMRRTTTRRRRTTSTTSIPESDSPADSSAGEFESAAASILINGPSVITHSIVKKEEAETKIEPDNQIAGNRRNQNENGSGDATTEATFSTSVLSSVTIKKKQPAVSSRNNSNSTSRPRRTTTTTTTTTEGPRRSIKQTKVRILQQQEPKVIVIHETEDGEEQDSNDETAESSLRSFQSFLRQQKPPKSRENNSTSPAFTDFLQQASSSSFQSLSSPDYTDDVDLRDADDSDDLPVKRASHPVPVYPPFNRDRLYSRGLLIFLKDFRKH